MDLRQEYDSLLFRESLIEQEIKQLNEKHRAIDEQAMFIEAQTDALT